MILDGYELEILADGTRLREYEVKVKKKMGTGTSYVRSGGDKRTIECHKHIVAEIIDPWASFTIRYHAPGVDRHAPLKILLIFNGEISSFYDSIIDDTSVTRSYLHDPKEPFNFANLKIPEMVERGQGAITVLFYRAVHVQELINLPKSLVAPSPVKKRKSAAETINRAPDGTEMITIQSYLLGINTHKVFDNDPIAVLHLHFRSSIWLFEHGIKSHATSQKLGDESPIIFID
ncbi:hypothetical protein G9A89_006214 [Geosiphon pyriformis]|nr:hypothetical protein G9A89_006214 [Geosiphon pyriformis]